MSTITPTFTKIDEKLRQKRLDRKHAKFNSQPGNRAYRRKMAYLERTKESRRHKNKAYDYLLLVDIFSRQKLENRIARGTARKAEREAEPEIAEKMRGKRLKEKEARHRIIEKKTLKRKKNRERNRGV